MTHRITRRLFLIQNGELMLGAFMLPHGMRRLRTGPIADLEKQLAALMKEHRVPSVSVAVIRDGRLAERRALGVKDALVKAPVDDRTMFEAASMSKPVFAYAVLKLCERGVLDLDAPLTRYTSSRLLQTDSRLDLITVRHVLSHTTG